VSEDKVTVECQVGDLAALFKDAPPMLVPLTFHEITVILNALTAAGEYGILLGGDVEDFIPIGLAIKEKCQSVCQAYLDRQDQ
jgi:hypothetical protein